MGVEKVEAQSEPEDHAAILCEIMSKLTAGALDAPAGADRQIFEKHIAPWMPRFFGDLERCKSADFYARVGALGRVFMSIETEASALPS